MTPLLEAPEAKAELMERLNAALNTTRERLGLTSDVALARALGVAPKTVWSWRTGRWHPAGAALITAIIGPPDALSRQEAA